jgi:anaerobic C4-dicarboxylate transporter
VKDHFVLSAFFEGRKTAGIPLGFGGGIGVGYAFKKRD